MKKVLSSVISVLLVVGILVGALTCFAGCKKKDDSKLYVGMECGYQPFNFTQSDDSNGAVKISNAQGYANGYDVMIAKKIAEELGKELVIVKYEFDSLINGVNSGTLDLIIAGMSPTAKRKEAIDFSDAYYESQLVIVVRKYGAFAEAENLDDFNGAKIVAQRGAFHDTALQEQGPAHGIVRQTPMDTFPNMIVALNAGTIDGYVAEEPGAIADCYANPDLTYIRLVNNSTGFTASAEDVQIAVGMKKGNAYLEAVNSALQKLSAETRNQLMNDAIFFATGKNVVD